MTTIRTPRIIPRERLARMISFARTHEWQAETSYNVSRCWAWESILNRLLEAWKR